MKYIYVLLSLCLPLHFAAAQSVSLGNISKLLLCTGDTVWVFYSSTGPFNADNFFAVQLSDASGSFSTFTNIGHATLDQGAIPIIIKKAGDRYRVRVISTSPYTISSSTSSDIQVLNYPSPQPILQAKKAVFFGYVAFIGDSIRFTDGSSEPSGSSYLWTYDQSANIVWSTTPSPSAMYNSVGIKTGSLKVSNSAGCETTIPFSLRILSCNPQIPESVHIVTGTETGNFPNIWVKTGGNYSTAGNYTNSTIFVEPGASLYGEHRTHGLYYIKNGASITMESYSDGTIVLLNKNEPFTVKNSDVDTLYCDDLQFDYSQVNLKEVKQTKNPLQIFKTTNSIRINCDGEMISTYIVDQLGKTMISKIDRDMIAFDLSSFANGVYFAVITSGDHREVRKLSVVH